MTIPSFDYELMIFYYFSGYVDDEALFLII